MVLQKQSFLEGGNCLLWTVEKLTRGYDETSPPQQSPLWNDHGSPWSNDARILMKESATLSKLWEHLLKTLMSSPEKRNGRKGLEINFLIERKVEQSKTTQKSHWKLTFFERKGRFNAAISRICFDSISNRVAWKNGKKRSKIQWVHYVFWR